MAFTPKTRPQIVADMASTVSSNTPITDFTPGSVILTLLEAAAQQDAQQYIQMLEVIRGYNLDTTEGADLDARAAEFGLTRRPALPHSGFVTISDSRFSKISSKIYAGFPGPVAGSSTIFVDDAASFPASGALYIGRGTANSEGPITYTAAPVDNTSYWTLTLDTALLNDHGTDETIILAQQGNRLVAAGTEVRIPENDFSPEVIFELNQAIELLDGEDSIPNVLVTAVQTGAFLVLGNSIIQFTGSPFTGAAVTNPLPFVNGKDEETDQELRDRIRDTIQSLSRGTKQSIGTGIIGLVDNNTNSSVVSANIIPPTILADGPTRVYIDNGRGLEPELLPVGLETVLTSATGGEQFFQLENFPLVKGNVVSQNISPFNLVGGETLIYSVGTEEESFIFAETDFRNPGSATAQELVEAINNRSNLLEARTTTDSDGQKVLLFAKASQNEDLQINSESTSQAALNFSTERVFTSKLYKNDKILTKDGLTASVISGPQPFNLQATSVTTTDADFTVTPGSKIVTKTVAGADPLKQIVREGDYVKFESDNDTFFVKVRSIIDDTKMVLENNYGELGGGTGDIIIWHSPQIEVAANGDSRETEVVSFSPNDFANPLQALASEVLVRMQAEINLSKTQLAVNDTRVQVLSEVENSADSKMQIIGGGAAEAMGFTTTSALSGTISVNGGEISVSGVGTFFSSELQEGQYIKVTSDDFGSWSKVKTIESDTLMFLETGYRGPNATSVSALVMQLGNLSSGSDKDYTLNTSNGQIELATPLVAGDNITIGSVNTRAFLDSFQETYDFDSLAATSELIVLVDGGFKATVTTGDSTIPYNSFSSTTLEDYETAFFVGSYIRFISGNNAGETARVSGYSPTTGQITTTTGFTNPVLVGDQFELAQVITIVNSTDFVDAENATAEEVAASINSQILGGKAEALSNGKVRIRTSNFSSGGTVQLLGGSANTILGFESESEEVNQETNTAFVTSANSDRSGVEDHLGFTLGPSQNLVVILDNDFTNRTFSIPLKVSGSVTNSGTGSFTSSVIGSNYPTTNFFRNFWVYWTSGDNEGYLQKITTYSGVTGIFTSDDVFPSTGLPNAIQVGDEFALVPRTSENLVALTSDLNTTTISTLADIEATGVSGDFVQIATKETGSTGKVFVTGGTGNSLGITVSAIVAGSPVNDLTTNSIAGLSKGLPILLTTDSAVTTGDNTVPYGSFIATGLITALPSYFSGLDIEFLTGNNSGFKTTISSYDNTTGALVLATPTTNAILDGDTFRISKPAFVKDIQGSEAPFIVSFNDIDNNEVDVTGFTPERSSSIRDKNGFSFSTTQIEGIDGYKYFTGLVQLAQFTIDGLDSDPNNFPGIGAAGTQFEVLPPVFVKPRIILDITTVEGVSLSSISDAVKSSVIEYINSLGIGEDVILSEIIAAAQGVNGVFDVEVSNFTDNIVIAENEQVRINDSDLVVG